MPTGYRTVLLDDLVGVLVMPDTAKPENYIFSGNGRLLTRSGLPARGAKAVGLAPRRRLLESTARRIWNTRLLNGGLRSLRIISHGYCPILYESDIDELTAMAAQTYLGGVLI